MKKYIYIIFALIFSAIIFSCDDSFDVNADWKDITVVYGLLDQSETTNYIKINKAFLGDDNALTMAEIPDSSSYKGNLEVKIQEFNGSDLLNTFILDTVTISNKNTGIFYNPNQLVYKTNAVLNKDYTYKLLIKNKESDKIISAETNLIDDDFTIKKPRSGQKINFNATSPLTAEWYSAENGKRYMLTIKFHYKEINLSTNDTTDKFIEWPQGEIKSIGSNGGEELSYEYLGSEFYTTIKSNLSYNDKVARIPGNIEHIFTVGGEELNSYIEVYEPSSSIIQEKPEYTNIYNGIGIFSSRYNKSRFNELSILSKEELINMNLSFIHIPE